MPKPFSPAARTSWPADWLELAQLAALSFLLGLGLLTALVVAGRMVGYRRRVERTREEELARLAEEALTDSLTGLGNHRSFHEDLRRELARRDRSGSCFSIVMLDLDGLKQINDTLGHQAGDEQIGAVADCLRATMRADRLRLPNGRRRVHGAASGRACLGRAGLRAAFSARGVEPVERAAVTCGIVEPRALESADTLLRRVDLALYDAKRSGRRIVVYADGLARSGCAAGERDPRHHRLVATALARTVDAKDAGTRNHCETASELCVLIGQSLGLDADRIERLRLAGLLHDVGKVGISDAIINKPGPLDPDEVAQMRGHVRIGHAIVASAELEEEARWVLHHHEHFDGRGYPDGLRGDEIPLESRIILVADAFEAMTADRPYRAARPVSAALAELERQAGAQFDPLCVDALRAAIADDQIHPQVDAA